MTRVDQGAKVVAPSGQEAKARGFKDGSIVRIQLHNFLTYSDVNFCPGPRLNVVLGPNGSGKSSIVCAIALGLAGTPKVLGRADNLADFVMHDKPKAYTEIELYTAAENIVIRRDFDRVTNKSTWRLNNRQVTEKVVKDKVKSLDIQVDNMCTFLPQDKVGDFSGFTPERMLLESEKALGGAELHQAHQDLINMQGSKESKVNEEAQVKKKLETLQLRNQALERDVERMKQRQEHLEKLETIVKKKLWVELEGIKAKGREQKEVMDAKKRAKEEAEKKHGPLEAKANEWTRRVSKASAAHLQAKEKKAAEMQRKAGLEQQAERCAVDRGVALSELGNLRTRRQQKQQKLVHMQRDREEMLSEQASIKVAELDAEKRGIDPQLREINHEKMTLENELGEIRAGRQQLMQQLHGANQRLVGLKNVKRQREENFRRVGGNQNTMMIRDWIDKNANLFRGPVHGPIALLVSVADPDVAKCLEQHVPNHVWKAFVTEDQADHDTLARAMKDKKASVAVYNTEGGVLRNHQETFSPQCMDYLKRECGIRGVLEEFYEAPDYVREVLRSNCGTLSVLMGTERTEECVQDRSRPQPFLDFISTKEGTNPPQMGSSRLFTATRDGPGQGVQRGAGGGLRYQCYASTCSKYSRKLSTSVRTVGNAHMLSKGLDTEAVAQLEQQIRNIQEQGAGVDDKIAELEHQLKEVASTAERLRTRRTNIMSHMTLAGRLTGKIKSVDEKIVLLEQELQTDADEEKQDLMRRLKHHTQAHLKCVADMQASVGLILDYTIKMGGHRMVHDATRRVAKKLEEQKNEARRSTEGLSRDYERALAALNRCKVEVRALSNRAKATAPMEDGHGNPTPYSIKQATLPATMEELTQIEQEYRGLVDECVDNPKVIKEFEETQAQIKVVTAQLEALEKGNKNAESQMDKIRIPWQTRLETAVAKLDALFQTYMQHMNCQGEVVISKEADFKDWGIQIRVKFRESTKLQTLSAQIHSGGERSVSTILYLMALQDLQHSPFRVVDEINQGMDHTNERMVFSRIVRNSCGPNRPQYFLITPKLLQGLTAMEHEDVTVLFVFNGPWNLKPTEVFSVPHFVKRRRELNDPEGYPGSAKRARTGVAG